MIFAKPWADALIVVLVLLLFFGPKRLPALGKSLGEGMREFKDSITGKSSSEDEGEPAGLNQAPPVEPPATAPPAAAPPVAGQPPVTSAPPPPPAAVAPASDAAPVASSEQRS